MTPSPAGVSATAATAPSDPLGEILEGADVARGENGCKVVGVEQRLLERPGRLRIVTAPQRDHDHLEVAVRVGLARNLVLEPEIDDSTHAVVERGLPARPPSDAERCPPVQPFHVVYGLQRPFPALPGRGR